ncbi:MAG: sodium:calcium antiporter [Myxococcota bacterium]
MTMAAYILLVFVGTALVWKGSGLLETAAERLAVHYRLPEVVQGAVVVAVGSSFPELSTTVISTLVHGQFELGVAAIVGSAIFNILVIPGLAGVVGGTQLQANRDLVYKEAQFYMLAVAVLLVTFALATIYHPARDPAGSEAIVGTLTRPLAVIPIAMYGLYVFVQWQDTMDHEGSEPDVAVSPGREWLRLGLSLALIVAGVEALVVAAIGFGERLGTPSFLWGITVLAAATSIPDAFVSVRAARRGKAVTSLANVLGSNIFDLLVCIPVGVLIAGTALIDFSLAVPMMAALTVATLVLFLAMRTEMRLSVREAWLLLAMYVGFVVWVSLESTAVIDTVPHFPR